MSQKKSSSKLIKYIALSVLVAFFILSYGVIFEPIYIFVGVGIIVIGEALSRYVQAQLEEEKGREEALRKQKETDEVLKKFQERKKQALFEAEHKQKDDK